MTPKQKSQEIFQISLSISLNNGKFIRRTTKSFGRANNIIKKDNWKKARIKIKYAWGDNYGEYTNKEDALLFMRTCREDYMYFKEEGWKKKKK